MARGVNVKLEIENLEEFIARLEQWDAQIQQGMSSALRSEADQILDRSEIIIPVDTGRLRGSRFVGIPTRWAHGMEVRFGFGTPYALYQHYGYYEHDDGRRMFLADPVKYSRRGLADRIRAILSRFIR